jgi:predicted nucleic acid-binding protein
VQAIFANVAILSIDSRIADVHAQIVSSLSKKGNTIGPHDNWVAAAAIAYGYELLTTNATNSGEWQDCAASTIWKRLKPRSSNSK